MSIHKKIKTARESIGISQSELARRIGVVPQTVQQWETEGGTAPKRTRLNEVARALGLDVDALIGEQTANKPNKNPVLENVISCISSLSSDKLNALAILLNVHPHKNPSKAPMVWDEKPQKLPKQVVLDSPSQAPHLGAKKRRA